MNLQWRRSYFRHLKLFQQELQLTVLRISSHLCILAILSAVGMYFGLRRFVGTEIIGWLCILVAIPFALAGFVRFQGMTAEKFVVQFIRSEILMPKYLVCQPYNLYAEILMHDSIRVSAQEIASQSGNNQEASEAEQGNLQDKKQPEQPRGGSCCRRVPRGGLGCQS